MMPARLVFVLCAAIVAVSGCHAIHSSGLRPRAAVATAQGLVEPPEREPGMSPAELGRQYRAAYAAGLAWAQRGEYGAALGAFEKAVELKPDSAEALFNLGACHEAIGDPARAINYYRAVLRLTPDDPDCYTNLGTSFIKMYYRERSPVWRKMARDAWKQSLELRPGQAHVQKFLATTESIE